MRKTAETDVSSGLCLLALIYYAGPLNILLWALIIYVGWLLLPLIVRVGWYIGDIIGVLK